MGARARPRRAGPLPPSIAALAAGTLAAAALLALLFRPVPGRGPTTTAPESSSNAVSAPQPAPATSPAPVIPAPPPAATEVAPEGAAAPAPAVAVRPRPPDDPLRQVTKSSEPLPADYVPADLQAIPAPFVHPRHPLGHRLRREAAEAFLAMALAAQADGVGLVAVSGFRSYEVQRLLYEAEVRRSGEAAAGMLVALPGRSEHQLGTTVDISTRRLDYELDLAFAATPEAAWLRAHAASHGFVLSYPQGQEAVTGYSHEPWHYRYVGRAVAEAIERSGRTPAEFLSQRQTIGTDHR